MNLSPAVWCGAGQASGRAGNHLDSPDLLLPPSLPLLASKAATRVGVQLAVSRLPAADRAQSVSAHCPLRIGTG